MPPFLVASGLLNLAGLAVLAFAPRLRAAAATCLIADHALLVGAGLWPRSRLVGPNLVRLPAARAAAGEVALTFDDGPDPEVTVAVLDVLDRFGAQASFFAVGRSVERYPEVVAEIARRGHRVENHSYRHSHRFSLLGPVAAGREIDRAQLAITAASGRAPLWFRAPAGLRSPLLELALATRGLGLASWTRRGFDTVTADPAKVARRLTRDLAAGDVLLLHDGAAATSADGRPVVLGSLPLVLAAIADRGLRAVAI